jgi:hypothetical protein
MKIANFTPELGYYQVQYLSNSGSIIAQSCLQAMAVP